MEKYITDTVRNNLKSVISRLSRPQQKSVSEVVRGLLRSGTPILRHLAQNKEVSAKKQGGKYGYHLGNVDLTRAIESVVFGHAKKQVKRYTIIAYDLSDINKESAKKMAKIRRIFDGSKRKVTQGYTFHGVGINQMLIKAEVHDGDKDFLPQIRKNIVSEITQNLRKKNQTQGVWTLDRGNDDKQFFHFLRSELKVDFVARVKNNRQVVLVKTGVVEKVKNLKNGQYEVYLLNRSNNKITDHDKFRLIIRKHLQGKPPIRLLTTLKKKRFSQNKVVMMYLERWGIENSFKRIKGKFGLEKVRVLEYQKLLNLIALTLFALAISTVIYQRIQRLNHDLVAGVLLFYKQFLKRYSLAQNLDSFISFLQKNISPLVTKINDPPNQLALLSYIPSKKLGSF